MAASEMTDGTRRWRGEVMNITRESTQNLRLAKSYIEALKKIPLELSEDTDDYLKKEHQYNEMLSLAYKHLDRALQYPISNTTAKA